MFDLVATTPAVQGLFITAATIVIAIVIISLHSTNENAAKRRHELKPMITSKLIESKKDKN